MAMIRHKRTWKNRVLPPVVKRVERSTDTQLSMYLDEAAVSLGCALDGWRYHGAPASEVERAIEAISALWFEVERRDQVKS